MANLNWNIPLFGQEGSKRIALCERLVIFDSKTSCQVSMVKAKSFLEFIKCFLVGRLCIQVCRSCVCGYVFVTNCKRWIAPFVCPAATFAKWAYSLEGMITVIKQCFIICTHGVADTTSQSTMKGDGRRWTNACISCSKWQHLMRLRCIMRFRVQPSSLAIVTSLYAKYSPRG